MNWKNKKVLVTGAGGFIGSHLIEQLVSLGADVRAFVHYNSRNDWGNIELISKKAKEKIEVVSGDIQDPFSVEKSVNDTDIVFHLAALIGIPYSYTAPESYVNVNIKGTLNVMQACLSNDVEKIISTSTSETYGTAQYVPIDEKHPLQGQSPYSASKIGADKIAESFYLSFGLPVAIIRPFNTFGPRQSARAIIPSIISQVLGQSAIKIGSSDPVRDFSYVADTISGFIKMAESEKSVGEVVNIGSGQGISIKDLIDKIVKLMCKKDTEIISETERIRPENSEVMRLVCDNSKARELINWTPSYTLDEGLTETIKWVKKHQTLYKPGIYNI